MNIAVLGSAFDPPTLGHLDVIKQCLEGFDQVWLVPAFSHAFDKKMSAYFHRVEMARAFSLDINNPKVLCMPCEDQIKPEDNSPVYSIDLMQYLKNKYPDNQYSLVLGPDNQQHFDRFYQSGKLKTDFSPFIAKERRKIRSTNIRQAIAKGKTIIELTTAGVAKYIHENDLYKQKSLGL